VKENVGNRILVEWPNDRKRIPRKVVQHLAHERLEKEEETN
jgi:hypothetical protein